MIKLTNSAVKHINNLLNKNSEKAPIAIRIGLKEGGCSGYKYTFEYANSKSETDTEVIQNNAKIFVKDNAQSFLNGATLDYIDKKINASFVFLNPNEYNKCSCGKSFQIKN